MKKLVVFLFCLVLLTVYTGRGGLKVDIPSDANPIIKESFAKQLVRSKRQRQRPGRHDEPMREHWSHMQPLNPRVQEINFEHCSASVNPRTGYPV